MKNSDTPIDQIITLTQAGLDELNEELRILVEEKLPKVIERITLAREHGDLSENAEYHSARDEQQLLQARIDEIEAILSKAMVANKTTSHTSIGLGSTVSIQKVGSKKAKTVTIVGEFEASPEEGKISSASPLGKALVGKKKGEEAKVAAPAGEIVYKIIAIK
ncbi:MAG: transcription elongation factor GreA [bacterium]|nr:transcription elongation factor GreA [bacterium]